MQPVGFIYDDIFLKHQTPPGHPESSERLVSIVKEIKTSGLWDKLTQIKPRLADYEDIARVHSQTYIERIKDYHKGYLDPDTYLSPHSLEAARYAAGAVIEALERCKSQEIKGAFCAVRPPGHHAERERAMGFCIFNNVAVGARYAQKIGYQKVFIVDFDVHHGNGTQHIFEEDDTVYYFSTHQYPHYPGTGRDSERGRGKGEGYTYNVTMEAGSGDNEYLPVYQEILPKLIQQFRPDIVLVSAGYDIHVRDPLASIRVSDEGIRGIVRGILSSMVNTIFALEGGYNLQAISGSVRITVEELLKH